MLCTPQSYVHPRQRHPRQHRHQKAVKGGVGHGATAGKEPRALSGACLYGWYYDTQAMFNTQNKHKARWKRWRKAFETVLIRAQHPEGFWQTNGHHKIGTHDTPGRILSTCLAALQLEVYYRYLPSVDMKKVNEFNLDDNEIEQVGEEGMVIEIGE